MSIPVQCMRCRGQFKVAEELAGKRVKCPKCSSHIQVPEPSVPSPNPQAPYRQAAPPPEDDGDDEGWSTPEWNDFDEPESSPETAGVPFPNAPRPGAAQDTAANPYQQISFGSVADFALDSGMISYALQWAVVLILVSVLAGAIVMTGWIPVSIIIEAVALVACGLGIVSGLSRQAALKLEHRMPNASDGWSLFGMRWLDLGLILAVWVGAILAVGLIFAVLSAISRIPVVGAVLGGVLVIPTFVIILITISFLTNLYLLPIIIGVEDCSISEAIKHLYRVTVRNGLALYFRYLGALRSIIPFMIFTGLLTAVALVGAVMVCGGEQFLFEVEAGGFSVRLLLFSLSISTIIAIYLAFVLVYVTVSFVMVYAESSKRVIVYR